MLKINNLSKSFKGKKVLDNISFEVKKGEVVVLLGPSGVGKTTILRCINGLEECEGGTIEIDGALLCEDVNGNSIYSSSKQRKEIQKKVGMIFQSYNLFPHMSVLENIIEAPVSTFGASKKEAEDNALDLLNSMGILGKKNSYPGELSGGEKQRAAIARACALNPKIMCFDEPTSALNVELQENVVDIIKSLSEKNMGILIITHDVSFARKAADKIITINEGKIIEVEQITRGGQTQTITEKFEGNFFSRKKMVPYFAGIH